MLKWFYHAELAEASPNCLYVFVYILTNANGNVMYIGMTNDLNRRVNEHQQGVVAGFTKKYNVHKLVYFEIFESVNHVIAREKQLKKWRRSKKNALVKTLNPRWIELTTINDSLVPPAEAEESQ